MRPSEARRPGWELAFWLYALWLAVFVVVKWDGDTARLLERMGDCLAIRASEPGYNLNLVPFSSLRLQLAHWPAPWAVKNLVGNGLAFLPLGFLLPAVWPRLRRVWATLLVSLAVICGVEAFQYLSLLGACDIDDLMLNLLGCTGGYLLFRCAAEEERA